MIIKAGKLSKIPLIGTFFFLSTLRLTKQMDIFI